MREHGPASSAMSTICKEDRFTVITSAPPSSDSALGKASGSGSGYLEVVGLDFEKVGWEVMWRMVQQDLKQEAMTHRSSIRSWCENNRDALEEPGSAFRYGLSSPGGSSKAMGPATFSENLRICPQTATRIKAMGPATFSENLRICPQTATRILLLADEGFTKSSCKRLITVRGTLRDSIRDTMRCHFEAAAGQRTTRPRPPRVVRTRRPPAAGSHPAAWQQNRSLFKNFTTLPVRKAPVSVKLQLGRGVVEGRLGFGIRAQSNEPPLHVLLLRHLLCGLSAGSE